jgi:hypothetical protein
VAGGGCDELGGEEAEGGSMTQTRLSSITADECLAFRRLPLCFDDMVRAIFAAGEDRGTKGLAARNARLADRLDLLAAHMMGAGDVPKDLAEAASLLRGESA